MKQKNNNLKPKAGAFSLIECLLVLMIISIISQLLLPNFSKIQNISKEQAIKTIGHTLQVSLESYHLIYSSYPKKNMSIEKLLTELIKEDMLTTPPKNPFTKSPMKNQDPSGKITYHYKNEKYTLKVYGYKNKKIILELTNY